MAQTPQPLSRKHIPAMLADTELLFRQARLGNQAFDLARPFPHVLLAGMIKAGCRVALCEGLREWVKKPSAGNYPQRALPSVVHLLLWELSSSTLLRHFSSLTGTPPLLPDPFLVQAGPLEWREEVFMRGAKDEFFARHPHTDLQNILRLEIFVADDLSLTFPLELVGESQPATLYAVASGSALLVPSKDYRMIYRSLAPERWCSLVSYYYINDRARPSGRPERNHEKQSSAY